MCKGKKKTFTKYSSKGLAKSTKICYNMYVRKIKTRVWYNKTLQKIIVKVLQKVPKYAIIDV